MDVEVAALTGSALVGLPHHLDEDKVSTYAQILGQLPPVVGTGEGAPYPDSPRRGVTVAFIEVSGAPVELMQIDHQARPDL
jgi:hypothetical protein